MKKISTEEVRDIQLKILKVAADYCDKENLTYYLGFGTLIGAVRHKGYIPWDDDIDILMPRADYEIFIRKFEDKDYDVKSHYKDSDYPYVCAKLSYEKSILRENMDLRYDIGINIDIFPVDTFPNSKTKIHRLYRNIEWYHNLLRIKTISINPKRKLYKNIFLKSGKILLTTISYKKIIDIINKKAMSYNASSDKSFMGCIVDSYGIKDIMKKEVFDNKIKLEFEKYLFYAPKRYHEYLTNIYGDYMTLPPEKNRETHHDFESFLRTD